MLARARICAATVKEYKFQCLFVYFIPHACLHFERLVLFTMAFDLLPAAMEYVLANPGSVVNTSALDEAAGVGVVISPEQIEQGVSKVAGSSQRIWLR